MSKGSGTAISVDLGWDDMDNTDIGSPITSSDWDKFHLGIKKSTFDGDLDFLTDFDTNTNVTGAVTGGNNSLKSGSLTSLGLLLDGQDAHDLIRELGLGVLDKSFDDWCLLDWDGVGVDFFELGDFTSLNESSELGEWGPHVSVAKSSSWSTSSSSTSSATSSASVTESSASIAAASASSSSSFSAVGSSFSWSWSSCWCCCWCFHL